MDTNEMAAVKSMSTPLWTDPPLIKANLLSKCICRGTAGQRNNAGTDDKNAASFLITKMACVFADSDFDFQSQTHQDNKNKELRDVKESSVNGFAGKYAVTDVVSTKDE